MGKLEFFVGKKKMFDLSVVEKRKQNIFHSGLIASNTSKDLPVQVSTINQLRPSP
jgi:hypothetical protein